MQLYTIIITDRFGGDSPKGYYVRAATPQIAAAHARAVYDGHNASGGAVSFIMAGRVSFHPTYEKDAFPESLIDLGTARYDD